MPERLHGSTEEAIGRIVGARLTSVQFVLDYLILGFDEKGALTTLVWPELHTVGAVVHFAEPNYRNDLCALIEQNVSQAAVDDEDTIKIDFGNGASLRIPLKSHKQAGERAILTCPSHYLHTW